MDKEGPGSQADSGHYKWGELTAPRGGMGGHHLLSGSGEALPPPLSERAGHTSDCSLHHLYQKSISLWDSGIWRQSARFYSALSFALLVTRVLDKALMMVCLSQADCGLTWAWWSRKAWLCSHSSYPSP